MVACESQGSGGGWRGSRQTGGFCLTTGEKDKGPGSREQRVWHSCSDLEKLKAGVLGMSFSPFQVWKD